MGRKPELDVKVSQETLKAKGRTKEEEVKGDQRITEGVNERKENFEPAELDIACHWDKWVN